MTTLAQVILRDVIANLPSAGIPGRLFFSTDTGAALRDNGASWDALTASSGLTFEDEAIVMTGTSGAFSHAPVNLLGLYKNGQRLTQLPTSPDFSVYLGVDITLSVAAIPGDFYEAVYWY